MEGQGCAGGQGGSLTPPTISIFQGTNFHWYFCHRRNCSVVGRPHFDCDFLRAIEQNIGGDHGLRMVLCCHMPVVWRKPLCFLKQTTFPSFMNFCKYQEGNARFVCQTRCSNFSLPMPLLITYGWGWTPLGLVQHKLFFLRFVLLCFVISANLQFFGPPP